MTSDISATVFDFRSGAHNRTYGNRHWQLKPLYGEGQLEYIGVDVLRPLSNSKKHITFAIVVMYSNTKLTKTITTSMTNASTASFSSNKWRYTVRSLGY